MAARIEQEIQSPGVGESSSESPGSKPLIVAGIGASAGGLEALERLFRSMPADSGVAFVVIQHLSPDFKSLMDELLARHTKMPIHRVEDGMKVEPNSIYLIPPKKDMIISGGKLLLTDKDPDQDLSLPIDHFFRSLAQDIGRRSIAVVLSGTGSDGSRGIRDVHEAGGLVIAQNEETAKFDGMPKSARDTGVVDCVLSPEDIPHSITDFVARPLAEQHCEEVEAPGEGDGDFHAIFQLLRDEYGIDFSYYKPNTVTRRIERRLSLNQSIDLGDYVERLREDASELNSLYRDLLIGVTRFFRDPAAFEKLEHEVLPDLLARCRPEDEVRIWVAGCATGEEPYSIAILVHEALQAMGRPINVKIFASDVHRASLDIASAGVYDEDALSEVPVRRLDRYFQKKPDGYHVSNELRQMVVFARHNLIKDAPFTRLDLITCRNLLIYFQPPAQKKALSLFHFGLKTGGVLFLGPSESPGELASEFQTIDDHWKFYRKRRDIRLPPDMRLPLSAPAMYPRPSPAVSDNQLLAAYDRLLEDYVPPGLLITDRRQLVHAFGGAGRFLSQRDGRPTSDILDLVEGDLKLALAGALQRAAKDQTPVVYTGIRLRTREGEMQFKLSVKPLLNKHLNLTHMFIALEELGLAPERRRTPRELDADEASREHVDSLETELRYTRENLQATIEELETSNEELQASNEELVASNEELQSTNEELHSVNEELYTVNAEYQKKISELTEMTDDMDNLLRSTEVGTIFLDENLCIRKFTPQIGKAFDLLPQDVGRRIDTFSHNIRFSGLHEAVAEVLKTGQPFEKDVRDRHRNWFLLRILPYRSRAKLEGVVLTLIDISSLKRSEQRIDQLSAIVESSDDAIIGMDLDGHITAWNRGAERLYCFEAEEVIGQHASHIESESEQPHLCAWPATVLDRKRSSATPPPHHEVIARRRDGALMDLLLSFSPITDSDGVPVGVSAIVRDNSDRKRAERALEDAAKISSLRADIGAALIGGEDPPLVLQKCTEMIATRLDVAFARIWTLEADQNELMLGASAGQYTHLDGEHSRIPVGELNIGRIAESGEPILTNDVAHDSNISDHEWAEREGLVAFAGYPLLASNRTVGVLAMFSRRPFPAGLFEDLKSIAVKIAQFIHRTQVEEALRKQEHRYRAIFEATGDALLVIDSEGRLLDVNPAACRMYDRECDRLLKMNAAELVHPEDGAQFEEFKQRVMAGEEVMQESRHVRQDGSERLVRMVGTTFQSDAPRLLLVVRDVTEQHQAQEAARRHSRQLERINQDLRDAMAKQQQAEREAREAVALRDRFLAMLSHELRNPLAAILNASLLLDNAELDSSTLGSARGAIERQSRQMARLLDDLLDVSRITRDKIEIRRRKIDLRETSREAIEAIRPLLQARKLKLEISLPEQPVCVDGDPARLQQIQVNLLNNAVKYTDPEGTISLSLRSEGDEAVLSIRDTGVGIPEEMQEKIFDIFVQLDGRFGQSDGGMGVGLTLVKALVKLHGGQVSVHSEGEGKGSEFIVRMPLLGAHEIPSPPKESRPNLDGMRVLLVEDNPDIRNMTRRLLQSFGCEVHAEEDGRSGLEAIMQLQPDVAIVDIGLPGLDGYEVARQVRQREDGHHFRLIAATGFGQESDRQKAREAGFDAHLVKPVRLKELVKMLDAMHRDDL
jgi:two-component system CheB/CheR fusion protein